MKCVFISFGYVLKNRIIMSYGNSNFRFLRNNQSIFHKYWVTLYFCQQWMKVFNFSPLPQCTLCFFSLNYNHSNRYKKISHCDFWLDLSNKTILSLPIHKYKMSVYLSIHFLSVVFNSFQCTSLSSTCLHVFLSICFFHMLFKCSFLPFFLDYSLQVYRSTCLHPSWSLKFWWIILFALLSLLNYIIITRKSFASFFSVLVFFFLSHLFRYNVPSNVE